MRKKAWTAQTEITDAVIRQREKRKWQIALRRYVFLQNPCSNYAPYFGLDAQNLRKWIEIQFKPDQNWETYSRNWQFDHVLPLALFNLELDEDLLLGWNFTNIRVETLINGKAGEGHPDMNAAKEYFEALLKQTNYEICRQMLEKINLLAQRGVEGLEEKTQFIQSQIHYIQSIANFSPYQYDQLNQGLQPENIMKEKALMQKHSG